MDHPPLTYASGKVQITREGDRLVVDFPPTESAASLWLHAAVTLGAAVICLLGAIWPGGITLIGGKITMEPGGGIAPRVAGCSIAAGLAAIVWANFRTWRLHTTLVLRGRTLRYSGPGKWSIHTREYDLSRYADVEVETDNDPDAPGIYLALKGADGRPDAALVARRSSARAELEAVADALRQAAWPDRAAQRPPRSTFTRVDADTLESDRGFVVRMPQVGVVEYCEGHDVLTLRVERAWSPEHQMCFVIRDTALLKWDASPAGARLPYAKQREIEYNLNEALAHLGVRFLVNATATQTASPHSLS